MAESAPIESAAPSGAARSSGIPRIYLYIIGGVIMLGIFLMGQRKSNTDSAPLAEPNTNIFLGSIAQQLKEIQGDLGLGLAKQNDTITSGLSNLLHVTNVSRAAEELNSLISRMNDQWIHDGVTPEDQLAQNPELLKQFRYLQSITNPNGPVYQPKGTGTSVPNGIPDNYKVASVDSFSAEANEVSG